ncbi:MAG: pyruvate:ferredoxin (flavodoxin) oxidoreductase, partial [Thermoanaerobaculia bacterium]
LTLDANEAVASVAHRLSEVIVIYPITPSSPMGEFADEWSAAGRRNLWGAAPQVTEMQSEAGAAGAVHGALQAGALATTFTASQGLLLMIPNMYKIAGELTPFAMHVAARTIATHALSIFGDHSDVMACRQTGFALLAASSVQEAQDFAAVSHAATLESRVPFLHFFDGFRTSHEVAKIEALSDDDLRALVDERFVSAHRSRALTPDHPTLRGTAQNPDTFFQAREASNPFHEAVPGIVGAVFERLATLTGRRYRLFDYTGHPAAERVIVAMGSGAQTAEETARFLAARGERVGAVTVRLYRPFAISHLIEAIPPSVRSIAVLDRTKEPGAVGEPLFLDVVAALAEARDSGLSRLSPRVVGGRYGLSSKEFTPAMAKSVFEELRGPSPRRRFTVGIVDDVTRLSLPAGEELDVEPPEVMRAVFFGLGADGTVGANKNTIKIIGEETGNHAQGYFVYDSKKSGAMTVSHLRFGPSPIRAPYLVTRARFVACHQFEFLSRFDVLDSLEPGGDFLLNAPYGPGEIWDHLPRETQTALLEKKPRFFVIDANRVARGAGLGGRTNTILQACFFEITNVIPRAEALGRIKAAIEKTYSRKGSEILKRNFAAVDAALANLVQVEIPASVTGEARPPAVPEDAPEFVKRVTAVLMEGKGDLLPVSAFSPDGAWPVGTARFEKRNIAAEIPVWDPGLCIQCNKCVLICPHAVIRAKVFDPPLAEGAPPGFKSTDFRAADFAGMKYTLQVAPEDCTGCALCVAFCPAKDKTNPRRKAIMMEPQRSLREAQRKNFEFFLDLPEPNRSRLRVLDVKGSQFFEPLFEFSGACAGCGETPYIKLLTQLFGDRLLMANATGCSSIYGGNLPTTPYSANREGRGPAWSNSLFEDNAEFGLGMRLALDSLGEQAREGLEALASGIGEEFVREILEAEQVTDSAVREQRDRIARLRGILSGLDGSGPRQLSEIADTLVRKSVWIVGGDGWAYDIGFGGLDHVLASGRDVNILVLDTEVYSNTGGQQSKATPFGAIAKFASAGKRTPKKDLGLIAMSGGNAYVASVAMGARDHQTLKAFVEAESYPGPSIVIAYSHCIAHGYDMRNGADQQKLAVDSGVWPLFRFDPRRLASGEAPLVIDAPAPKARVAEYLGNENRFRALERLGPSVWRRAVEGAEQEARRRQAFYRHLAAFREEAAPKVE